MSALRKGTCHCGGVEFTVRLENGLENLRRCNCSLCRRKGAIMAMAPLDALTVTRGAELLTLYTWNTGVAKHYFCKVCGIYTHHQRRSNPAQFGFNVACIEGVDPFALTGVEIADGASQTLIGKTR